MEAVKHRQERYWSATEAKAAIKRFWNYRQDSTIRGVIRVNVDFIRQQQKVIKN